MAYVIDGLNSRDLPMCLGCDRNVIPGILMLTESTGGSVRVPGNLRRHTAEGVVGRQVCPARISVFAKRW
jgi:hypothetical protein